MIEATMQWQEWDRELPDNDQTPGRRGLLLTAVGASLLLHSVLLALFASVSMSPVEQSPPPDHVQIRLVPDNPLLAVPPALEPAPAEVAEAELALPAAIPVEPTAETFVEVVEQTEVDIPEPISTPLNAPEATNDNAPAPTPRIVVPSLLTLQRTLEDMHSERQARSWLYECNPLQEESGLRECRDRSRSNFANVERNRTYEALNPIREFSRSQRSLTTVYANTATLAGRLNTTVPGELGGYLMEELQAATSLYTNNGTTSLQHIQRMANTSAAAEQAERVLGDGWVQGRVIELQQRKVHAN